MWAHAVDALVCPRCSGALQMRVVHDELQSGALIRADSVHPARSSDRRWIESGVLSCLDCRCIYPIHRGVPILLRYSTALARTAYEALPQSMRRELLDGGFGLSGDEAPLGERHVGASFSTQWEAYEYGGTLWTASTTDRVQTFRGECGLRDGDLLRKRFCEIGCGLGILTNEAAAGLGAEAWGMDVSTAVFRAAAQFRSNTPAAFRAGVDLCAALQVAAVRFRVQPWCTASHLEHKASRGTRCKLAAAGWHAVHLAVRIR